MNGEFRAFAINDADIRHTEASLASDVDLDGDVDLILGNSEGEKSQLFRTLMGEFTITLDASTLPAEYLPGEVTEYVGTLAPGVQEKEKNFALFPIAVTGSASIEGRVFSDSILVDGKEAEDEEGIAGIRVPITGQTALGTPLEAET